MFLIMWYRTEVWDFTYIYMYIYIYLFIYLFIYLYFCVHLDAIKFFIFIQLIHN